MNRHDRAWDWLDMPAPDAAALVARRIYARDRWGCFSARQRTASGVFYWFDWVHELLTFVALVEPVVSGVDGTEVAPNLLGMVDDERRLTQELRIGINAVAKGLFRLEWWGRGSELATSRGDFAQELRREFRNGGVTGAILPAEMRDWEKFVRAYVAR